jgi:AcrR family transcriptional regulator
MDTKNLILKVGLKQFLRMGYDKTSLNSIAKEVGISKPSTYYYFKNKEELFENVLMLFFTKMEEWSKNQYENCHNFHSLVSKFFNSFADMKNFSDTLIEKKSDEASGAIFELLIDSARKNPKIKQIISDSYKATGNHIKEKIIEAQNNGLISQNYDAKTLAFSITAIMEGTMLIGFFNNYKDIEELGVKMTTLFFQIFPE